MKNLRKGILIVVSSLFLFALALLTACGNTVTISFETGGGDAIAPVEAEIGSDVTLPIPEFEGKVFEGWYLDPTFSGAAVESPVKAPEKDTVYYAKWAEGVLLTLDLDNGTLPEGSTRLYLKAGTNLSEALSGLRPQKGSLTFGNWFDGEEELSSSRTMPATPLTLKARYQVEYTVEVHLQNLTATEYQKDDDLTATALDYVGKTVSGPAPSITGFQLAEETSIVLSEDRTRNVLSLEYDRLRYDVRYQANAPADTTVRGTVEGLQRQYYGSTFQVAENRFEAEGYRFAGWSLTPSSVTPELFEGDEATVSGTMNLFAVWERGYTDRYGGLDLIFFPRLEPEKAYLRRGDVEFEGTRTGDDFSFPRPSGALEGKVFGNVFAYKREALAGTYYFYTPYEIPGVSAEDRLERDWTLVLDSYLNATLTETDENEGAVVLKGALTAQDAAGSRYTFFVTDGPAGTVGGGFDVRFGTLADGTLIYERGNNEANVYFRFIHSGDGYVQIDNSVILLDGFGSVDYYFDSSLGIYSTNGSYYIQKAYGTPQSPNFVIHVECIDDDTAEEASFDLYTTELNNGTIPAYVLRNQYCTYEPGDLYYTEAETPMSGVVLRDGKEVPATLTLDGWEIFEDSAVLRIGDEEIKGGYSVRGRTLSDPIITITVVKENGDKEFLEFFLGETSFRPYTESEREYDAYYLLRSDDVYITPLLTLFDESVKDGDRVLGKKAEIRNLTNGEEYTTVASGYYTEIRENGFTYYRFTRTSAASGYRDLTPESMDFLLNVITNGNNDYNVYYLLSRRYAPVGDAPAVTEMFYTVLADGDGRGDVIWYMSPLAAPAFGTVYFTGSQPIEGSLVLERDIFGMDYGTFQWVDAAGNYRYYYFEIRTDRDGNPVSFRRIDEIPAEHPCFYVDSSGAFDSQTVSLMLYGEEGGNAVWAPSGDWEGADAQRGSYRITGYTSETGLEIFTFYNDSGIALFDFVQMREFINDTDGSSLEINYYWVRNYEQNSEPGEDIGYSIRTDHGELVLDGYRMASYRDENNRYLLGNYMFNRVNTPDVLYFTTTDGSRYVFRLIREGSEIVDFESLDEAYGEFTLYAEVSGSFGDYYLALDGKEGASLLDPVTRTPLEGFRDGWYEIESSSPLIITLGGLRLNSRTLNHILIRDGACTVQDPYSGEFFDDDWNVLVLDGYGNGVFYGANGDSAITGIFNLVDETMDDRNAFGFLRLEDYSALSFAFDPEAHTFRLAEYPEEHLVYYTGDFSHRVAVLADGFTYLDNSSGPYYIAEDAVYVYLMLGEGGYDKKTLPALPEGNLYSYEGREYYLVDLAEELSLTGTISFDGTKGGLGTGGTVAVDAVLKFRLGNDPMLSVAATLSLDGTALGLGPDVSYSVRFTNYRAVIEENGNTTTEWAPYVLYNNAFSPITIVYHRNGVRTFTATGFDVTATRYDDYELMLGTSAYMSELRLTYYGYGPIRLGEATYGGELYYEPVMKNGEPLAFENVPYDDSFSVARDFANGERFAILFEGSDGKKYAMQYYTPDMGYYELYLLTDYEEYESGEYRVGVGHYVHSNLYSFDGTEKTNDFSAVFLYKDGTIVMPFFSGVGVGRETAWLVDNGTIEYDPSGEQTGDVGKGYLISFRFEDGKISGIDSIGEYDLKQALDSDRGYLFNFFVNEEDELFVSFAVYDEEENNYLFHRNVERVEKTQNGYEIHDEDGVYTVTFLTDDGGERIVEDDCWIVRVTYTAAGN